MSFKFSNKVNYKLFTETLTKESSYILGLLWADGSVHKKSNSISIECVREDINNFYPIFETVGEFNLYYRDRENRRPQGTINCSSLELSNFLKKMITQINHYLLQQKYYPSYLKICINIFFLAGQMVMVVFIIVKTLKLSNT